MYWALSTHQKFWFEISAIPYAQWNGTFRFHRPVPSHRTFGYCSCKQDTKERYWGQQFCQMERDVLIRPTVNERTTFKWKVVPNIQIGLNRNSPRVLSRIHRLGEKSRVATSFLAESGDIPPPEIFWNGYALRSNLVHFETQFWEMLQRYFILFLRHDHVPCHIVSLDRKYLIHVH